MNINFNDYEQLQADSDNVFLRLECEWEGFTLAVACNCNGEDDARFVSTEVETGKECDYFRYDRLMEIMEGESDDEEEATP